MLNKYFPPDFDPALIPRRKGPKNSQQVVRLMAPFSMYVCSFWSPPQFYSSPLNRRCNICGEYIYKGKKFNARKETVEGEDYYGIKIFRFYIKWYALHLLFHKVYSLPRVVHYVRQKSLSRPIQRTPTILRSMVLRAISSHGGKRRPSKKRTGLQSWMRKRTIR